MLFISLFDIFKYLNIIEIILNLHKLSYKSNISQSLLFFIQLLKNKKRAFLFRISF